MDYLVCTDENGYIYVKMSSGEKRYIVACSNGLVRLSDSVEEPKE